MSYDDIPNQWTNSQLSNGETRTLLNIMMQLDPEHDKVCDFVVVARIFSQESHRHNDPGHRGVIFTCLEPDEVESYLRAAIRRLDD